MGGEKTGLRELGDLGVDAHDAHEVDGLVDLAGEFFILLALGGAAHELVVPGMNPFQGGVTAHGKGSQDVQGGAGQMIAFEHPLRVGLPGLGGWINGVDHVAPVAGELKTIYHFGIGGAGLGVLSGHAPHLDHRFATRVAHDYRHLQDHLEQLPDGRGGAHGKLLGAVAALKQESLALDGQGQLLLQGANLPGKDQGWQFGDGLHRLGKLVFVRPVRLLQGIELLPACFAPRVHDVCLLKIISPICPIGLI